MCTPKPQSRNQGRKYSTDTVKVTEKDASAQEAWRKKRGSLEKSPDLQPVRGSQEKRDVRNKSERSARSERARGGGDGTGRTETGAAGPAPGA